MIGETQTIIDMLTRKAKELLANRLVPDSGHEKSLQVESTQPASAQVESVPVELTDIQIFKYIIQDIDNDGEEEICFAAGRMKFEIVTEGGVWLLDRVGDNYRTIELVAPWQEGFRDLLVRDIDKDQKLEIFSIWRRLSSALLTLYVLRWDGNSCTSLFPAREEPFYQGLVEIKDIDADGLDEIVIWEGIAEMGRAQWQPKRFAIHSFHYNNHIYEFISTYQTTNSYSPASIVEQSIGVIGIPNRPMLRTVPIETYQRRYEMLSREHILDEQFINELIKHLAGLYQENFYEEALKIAELAIRASHDLPISIVTKKNLIYLCHMKALTFTRLGNYQQAIHSYKEAFFYCTEDLVLPIHTRSDLERELAFMYARISNFEHALTLLSHARDQLEMNYSEHEVQEALARVYSAFAYTYSWLGDVSLAITSFKQAIQEDQKLGRAFALSIDYTGLGNMQRSAGQYQAAIESYQNALNALSVLSDRDLEADVYLELGITLMLTSRNDESLKYLLLALLLSTEGNLWQQGVRQYLYLGEAYRRAGQFADARRRYEKTLDMLAQSLLPETKWQTLYGLALVYQQQQRLPEAQSIAAEAIELVEQLRTQYLPEALKVSLQANGKADLYATMVELCILLAKGYRATDATDSSFTGQAFEYVERAKSRVFIEELATSTITRFADLPTYMLQQEASLITELRSVQLRNQEQAQMQRYEWGDEIKQLERQLMQLWESIHALGSRGEEYVGLRQAIPLSFTQLKAVLSQKEA